MVKSIRKKCPIIYSMSATALSADPPENPPTLTSALASRYQKDLLAQIDQQNHIIRVLSDFAAQMQSPVNGNLGLNARQIREELRNSYREHKGE